MDDRSGKECNITAQDKVNSNLYKEELMDHFKNPRNKEKISNPDFSSGQYNPSCGDSISIEGKVAKNEDGTMTITQLGFDGSGCVISIASASMLTEHCIGKRVDDVLRMTKDDLLNLLKIDLGPIRIKCALLCLTVLQDGLKNVKGD